MELLMSLLSVAAVIVAATLCHKRFPQIPLPFFLIGLGAFVSWLPFPENLEFEPAAFMVCLIAPILFGDGRVISRKELWEYRKPILLMALWLVVFTVVGIGYVIHFLIPSMPLPVAFALAAVMSPTDAVAVKSMTKGRTLPKGLMPILEGESLLNDAAGLVSFKVAIGVVMTGVFSVKTATWEFLFVALGGCLVGLILGAILVNFRLYLRKEGLEEVQSLVTIQLMTPFLVYLLAEELHVSGILAVVVAGIVHGLERDRLQQTTTKMHIISTNTWSVLSYILNGFVFALLGLLLPEVITGLIESGEASFFKALGLAIAIYAALFVARYVWVYFFHDGFGGSKQVNSGVTSKSSRRGYALAASVCGVHGTITLATALAIPFELSDGTPFPLRNTILFIAASVILLSMLVATFAMPFLAKPVAAAGSDPIVMTTKDTNIYLANKAKEVLKSEGNSENREATVTVMQQLEEQIRIASFGTVRVSGAYIRELQQVGRTAEAAKLAELVEEGVISPQLQSVFAMLHRPHSSSLFVDRLRSLWLRFKLNFITRKIEQHGNRELPARWKPISEWLADLKKVEKQLHKAAVIAIREQTKPEHKLESLLVIQHYSRIHRQENGDEQSEEAFLHQLRLVQLRSVQIKRDLLQELEESQQISTSMMHEFLQAMNYEEMLILDSGEG